MRKSPVRYLLVALATGLAACNDGTVAPASQGSNVVSNQGLTAALTHDTSYFSFTVNNSTGGSFYLGAGNSVRFPAGTMCDPSSSYGTTEWDNPCTAASAPVTVQAKAWLDATNHPRVDFVNHLRFVPTSNAAQYVTIVFTDTTASTTPTGIILYCASTTSSCVSESSDPTLVTVKNPVTHLVTRRIKHFSGYAGSSGDDGCPPDNPDCVLGGAGFNKIHRNMIQPDGNTASALIGAEGGVLSLPQTGLSVVIPAGAVSAPTLLSVSARPGQLLAYEFQPHGIQFAEPLRVVQSLGGTGLENVSASSLRAVYFADESQVDNGTGAVVPTELMNVDVNATAGTASFMIHHFSGYMFATGAEDGTITDAPAPQPHGTASMSLRNAGGVGVTLTGVPRAGRASRSMK